MKVSTPEPAPIRAKPQSVFLIVAAWAILQLGGLFSPGLLDDVDSVYLEVAREMLHRHDFVTPMVDGIRFFDKPPLMYWMAASSMRLFGEFDWAGRLPLALGALALFLSVYALGLRLLAAASPLTHPDRGALYAALGVATAIGPYLYTRFYIPDILIALWMTLSVHLFLIALDRISPPVMQHEAQRAQSRDPVAPHPAGTVPPSSPRNSALLPCLLFAATLALNLLTKGLIGILFPIAFVLFYLGLTRRLRLLPRFHLVPSTLVFLVIALPWHLLAALRNPAIAMPAGLGLPARAGWAWFYLYNEHVARFLGERIPHDYGQTPVPLFWLYAALWIFPWAAFLPAAIARSWPSLRLCRASAALNTTLWALLVLAFFTVSSRQEYYSLPALPALALMVGGLLASADRTSNQARAPFIASSAIGPSTAKAQRAALFSHRWLLLPIVSLAGAVCAYFAITAPEPGPGADLATLLSNNPALYNLSLGHLFDLTGAAMGLFRGPLVLVALAMAVIGPVSYGLRRSGSTFAANLSMAGGMTAALLAAHVALVSFNPILGSKGLADAILVAEQQQGEPGLILLDGELTSGSTLLFYTREPVHLVNGRINGPWFGSFWPDAPPIFETEASLRRRWAGPERIFLMTATAASRKTDLASFGPVHTLAEAGGKTVLTNR